ncbi:MFS transporter [Aestuariivita boseongensis]|uniref:MFS transporter n=1 Tax=Aestuariivita boseongensis TaxID=1470562 RepID=UPI0006824148|nr:MFS transporter [Aestuariivita boseongensis]
MVTRTPFGLILLIWCAGLGAAAQYGKISVIYDQLPGVYPKAGAALGFLVSLVGFVGIVFGVVAGLLVARIGYRNALIWALWGGAALSAVQALLPPLPLMLGLRALEGASHLAIVVAAPTLIAQLSAPRHQGLTLTLWSTFFGVSYTVLVWLGLPLAAGLGLPSLFLAHALWMALLALVLGRALSSLGAPAPAARLTFASVLRDHLTIYRSPFISAAAIGWLFYTFCFLALLTLIPPYLPDDLRAPVLGAMPLVSIAVSMTLGVFFLRFIPAIVEILVGFALTILCLLWLCTAPGLPLACLALAAALGLVQGASFAVVPQLNKTAIHQAQANGAIAQMGNVGNTLGTPVLAAVLSIAGYHGMIGLAALVFTLGIGAHIWMAIRRRS